MCSDDNLFFCTSIFTTILVFPQCLDEEKGGAAGGDEFEFFDKPQPGKEEPSETKGSPNVSDKREARGPAADAHPEPSSSRASTPTSPVLINEGTLISSPVRSPPLQPSQRTPGQQEKSPSQQGHKSPSLQGHKSPTQQGKSSPPELPRLLRETPAGEGNKQGMESGEPVRADGGSRQSRPVTSRGKNEGPEGPRISGLSPQEKVSFSKRNDMNCELIVLIASNLKIHFLYYN